MSAQNLQGDQIDAKISCPGIPHQCRLIDFQRNNIGNLLEWPRDA
jgi:hypothetical protein